MDSIDAECLLFSLTDGSEVQPPDQWQHLADGALAFRFGDSSNDFTWPPEQVAEMAKRWRDEGGPMPSAVRGMAERHEAFVALLERGERSLPDRIIHDFRTDEMVALWNEEKVTVVVDPEPETEAGVSSYEPGEAAEPDEP